MKIVEVKHPLVKHKLGLMREHDISTKRFRELAPNAHTLAEIMHARHGNQSQMILAGSNIVGSVISLMVNWMPLRLWPVISPPNTGAPVNEFYWLAKVRNRLKS